MSEAALEGDLRHFQPAELLQLLQLAQASGRLELVRARAGAEPETVEVSFEAGRPVAARTSGASVRTGEILVHRGQLTNPALEAALAEQRRRPERRIGALLASAGAASPPQVAAAVREAVRRILYGVLLWREGRFRFSALARSEPEDLPLEIDLDRLILEGLRLADQARAGR
ncbi:MAG: DUF4388 domain-containing protein [Candidatus Eisenbacteria bacterium]|nr:DUF4388 domain-containing protein [Candidatus Eisenbacteria bacterium]